MGSRTSGESSTPSRNIIHICIVHFFSNRRVISNSYHMTTSFIQQVDFEYLPE